MDMLVKNWMTQKVIIIDSEAPIPHAISMIKKYNIRMLPVLKKGELVGVITDRDLKRASASDATSLEAHELAYLISKIKVGELMSKKPITVPFDYSLEEAAEILLKNKINGVPVVDYEGSIVGVITQTDLQKALLSLTGIGERGIQFGLKVEDRAGSLEEASDTIRSYGGRMISVLSSGEEISEGYRHVYIRMRGIDRSRIEDLKKDLSAKATLLYMIDHREGRREIYKNGF
jgi:acetoin utilization protein AcuB